MASVGQALVDRGHHVTVVTTLDAEAANGLVRLPHVSLPVGEVQVPRSPVTTVLSSASGSRGLLYWFKEQAAVSLDLLPAALDRLDVDGAVVDQLYLAGGTAAQRVGIPFATLSPGPALNADRSVPPCFTGWRYHPSRVALLRNRIGYAGAHLYLNPVLRSINRRRAHWGLDRFNRIDDAWSPLAQLTQMPAMLDYPRSEAPPNFHHVGALGDSSRIEDVESFPWDRLDERPLVYASMGTAGTLEANIAAYERIIDACRPLDAQLVVALGHHDADESVERLRRAARLSDIVVSFAPQQALLDRAELLLTHGGANSVLEALSRSVPILVLPRENDQPAVARRAERAGVGLVGSFRRSNADEIRALIERVLGDVEFRQRAGEVAREIETAGGCPRAAEIIEQALLSPAVQV